MSYFTETQLLQAASTVFLNESAKRLIKSSPTYAETTIFLSHSHKDKRLAEGLKNYLATLGISLYIDWQDTDMPERPNRVTADNLKKRIAELNIFLMLCTDNALQSRWVPWEIGVADSIKRNDKILIAPVKNNSGGFSGNEYLQLYPRIEFAVGNQLAIFEPNKSDGYLARNWFQVYG